MTENHNYFVFKMPMKPCLHNSKSIALQSLSPSYCHCMCVNEPSRVFISLKYLNEFSGNKTTKILKTRRIDHFRKQDPITPNLVYF